MKYILTIFILSLYSGLVAAADFGSYLGSVKAEWMGDGRRMKLLESFEYIDQHSISWVAPKGAIIDGASIPKIAWPLIGGPFEGKYRNASVIHDVGCVKKQASWEAVHLTFYNGMRASGVSEVKAAMMYAAVYHFGPRWPFKLKVRSKVEDVTQKIANFKMSRTDPSLYTVEVEDEYRFRKESTGYVSSFKMVATGMKEIVILKPLAKSGLKKAKFNKLLEDIKAKGMTLKEIRDYQ